MRKSKQKKEPNANIDETAVMKAIKNDRPYKAVRSIIEAQLGYKPSNFNSKLLLSVSKYYSTKILNHCLKNTDGVLMDFSLLYSDEDRNTLLHFAVSRHTIEELSLIIKSAPEGRAYHQYHTALGQLNNKGISALDLTPLHQDEKFCRLLFKRASGTLLQILKKPSLLKLYLESYNLSLQVMLILKLDHFFFFGRKIKKAIKAEPEIYNRLYDLQKHMAQIKECSFSSTHLKRLLNKAYKENTDKYPFSSKYTLFQKGRTASPSAPASDCNLVTHSSKAAQNP